MDIRRAAALLYAVISAGVVAFQIALAAGAPWGAYAMGGAMPGQLPPANRQRLLQLLTLLIARQLPTSHTPPKEGADECHHSHPPA